MDAATRTRAAVAGASDVAADAGKTVARTRYGIAFPIVRAPTMVPIASPRRERNQVEIIFIAGGYTPARKTPALKRVARAVSKLGANSSAAFAIAPSTAETAKYRAAGMRSARL